MIQSSAPKDMLRQIRDIMAMRDEAGPRMQKLVSIIADSMQAQVCSIYLRNADDTMELWATKGLAAEAIHKTKLAPNEGLVGEVAKKLSPVHVKNAQEHQAFSFQPETMEQDFISFLGVPILRARRLLGVLVVQDNQERLFSQDAVEALQNVAMVLAEIVASGELLSHEELAGVPVRPLQPLTILGKSVVSGLAMGQAVLFEPHIVGESRIAEDPEVEMASMLTALDGLRKSLDQLFAGKGHAFGEPTREVMNAYRMFAHDQSWVDRLSKAINAGLTAEAAVERVRGEYRHRLLRAKDPYLRERLHDLEDLSNRLLRHLGEEIAFDLPKDTILVARNIGPAELLELDRSKLRGLVLEEGSRTSHAAIVAGAMRLPVVGALPGLLAAISEGNILLVDAEAGSLQIRPNIETKESFIERLRVRQQQRAVFSKLKDQPAISIDGQRVELLLNAGLKIDLPQLETTGADGIGLFRTEFQFLLADQLPKQQQLTELYSDVFKAAKDKPVIFRTLDLGGDKVLPYVTHAREPNPALGWRAIRMAIDRPGMFRYQLRALLAAASGKTLRVMFPLVSTVNEFLQAKELLKKEVQRLKRFGHTNLPAELKIGCMIETPAMIWQLDRLLPHTDFISVGANDLMQYFFAADRENIRVSERYDPLHIGAILMLREIVDAAKRHNVSLSICGEMAGRRADAALLLALGFRQLSVTASAIGPLKQLVLSLDIGALSNQLKVWLGENDPDLRKKLLTFAKSEKINL